MSAGSLTVGDPGTHPVTRWPVVDEDTETELEASRTVLIVLPIDCERIHAHIPDSPMSQQVFRTGQAWQTECISGLCKQGDQAV